MVFYKWSDDPRCRTLKIVEGDTTIKRKIEVKSEGNNKIYTERKMENNNTNISDSTSTTNTNKRNNKNNIFYEDNSNIKSQKKCKKLK